MTINRIVIHEKYGGRCAYCGHKITIKEMQVDHIHPRFLAHHKSGDINDPKNLNPSCRVCNKWKATYTVDEFRHELEMQINRLRQRSASFRIAERFALIEPTYSTVVFYFEKEKP